MTPDDPLSQQLTLELVRNGYFFTLAQMSGGRLLWTLSFAPEQTRGPVELQIYFDESWVTFIAGIPEAGTDVTMVRARAYDLLKLNGHLSIAKVGIATDDRLVVWASFDKGLLGTQTIFKHHLGAVIAGVNFARDVLAETSMEPVARDSST